MPRSPLIEPFLLVRTDDDKRPLSVVSPMMDDTEPAGKEWSVSDANNRAGARNGDETRICCGALRLPARLMRFRHRPIRAGVGLFAAGRDYAPAQRLRQAQA